MSEFRKFNSLENSYNTKNIRRWLHFHPELKDELFTVEEKIDGANLSIIVKKNKELFFASRNQVCGNLEFVNFFTLSSILPNYLEMIEKLRDFASHENHNFNFYFEFYGPHIKRVDYGGSGLLMIGTRCEEEMICPKEYKNIMKDLDLSNYLVPSFGDSFSFDEALEFSPIFLSLLNPKEGNFAEGVTIKPTAKTYENQGSIFVLKNKSPNFAESKNKKFEKTKIELSNEIIEMQDSFDSYITENRMIAMFSKMGKTISSPNEIGTFLPAILEDAFEDWLKDIELEEINKDTKKKVAGKATPKIVQMLKDYIKNS